MFFIKAFSIWQLAAGTQVFIIFSVVMNRRNKKVYAWTVDDEESMRRMLFEDVDAIVTSDPTSLQRLMQDIKLQCLEEGYA